MMLQQMSRCADTAEAGTCLMSLHSGRNFIDEFYRYRSRTGTCLVYLQSGRKTLVVSMIWNAPCLLFSTGFCPVIISIGNAPR